MKILSVSDALSGKEAGLLIENRALHCITYLFKRVGPNDKIRKLLLLHWRDYYITKRRLFVWPILDAFYLWKYQAMSALRLRHCLFVCLIIHSGRRQTWVLMGLMLKPSFEGTSMLCQFCRNFFRYSLFIGALCKLEQRYHLDTKGCERRQKIVTVWKKNALSVDQEQGNCINFHYHNVLRSSVLPEKEMNFYCFLCSENPSIAHNLGTIGPIQMEFSAKTQLSK